MPVHYSQVGAVLLVAVDGDFTVPELARVLESSSSATPARSRVLLDFSGAASLAHKSDGELAECAGLFADQPDRFGRIAILVTADPVDDMLRLGTAFVARDRLEAMPFRSREDAEAWLLEEA